MKECKLRGSNICHNINAGKGVFCDRCFVDKLDADKQASMKEGFEITQSLLPEGGVDWMKESETCVLCLNEPEKQSCYGVVYMAHKEPPAHKRMFLGLGKEVRSELGSLIPVELSACSKCRSRHFWIGFVRPALTLGLPALVLLLLLIPGVSVLFPFPWSLIVLAAAALVGAGASMLIREKLIRQACRETAMEPGNIEALKEMMDKGWVVWTGGSRNENFPIDFRSWKSPNKYDPS